MRRLRPRDIATLAVAFTLSLHYGAVLALGTTPPAPLSHVITIVMENREYSQVIGNSSAPYENSLATRFAVAANYYAVAHPSLPNYLALVTGSAPVSSDCLPIDCPQTETSVVDLLTSHGLSWREYAESMPANCSQSTSPDGLYEPKHDPFVYLTRITGAGSSGGTSAYCQTHVVGFSQFAKDLATNSLPDYTFITPNNCDDAHDCDLPVADRWLSTVVPEIIRSPEFSSSVVFVIYDEGSTDSGPDGTSGGGRVACIAVSPFAKQGYESSVAYTHYSLLATTEAILGLGSLGRADSAVMPMADLFTTSLSAQSSSSTIPEFPGHSSIIAYLAVFLSVALVATVAGDRKPRAPIGTPSRELRTKPQNYRDRFHG